MNILGIFNEFIYDIKAPLGKSEDNYSMAIRK